MNLLSILRRPIKVRTGKPVYIDLDVFRPDDVRAVKIIQRRSRHR